jgi:RHS repeat-associated protein
MLQFCRRKWARGDFCSVALGFTYDTAPTECPAGETFHVGRLARMTVGSSDGTAFCYDRFGNLTRKVQTTQGRSFTVRYDHAPRIRNGTDAPGRPRPPATLVFGMTYPDGALVRIGRNGRGDATDLTVTLANGQVKTLVSGTVHYPFGPAWWWTYGNGRKLTRSRTPSGRPGFVEDSRAGGLSEGYWFDAAGNLDSLRNASQADPPKRKYSYDGLDRLTEVRDGASNALLQGYGYNATGDRTTDTNGATRSFAYATGTHRLSSAGSVNRAYDAAGNTIRIGGAAALAANRPALAADTQARSWRAQAQAQARAQTARAAKRGGKASVTAPAKLAPATVREFAYDDAGRLKQVKRDGVVAMDYRYNARGERVYRSGSGQTVHTVYDEAGHWLGDYDVAGNAIQQAIWLDDLPVGLLVGAGTNQKLYYLEPDALGSPRVAIDPDRDVAVWRWDLAGEAFGNSAPNEDPDGDGIAFTLDMRFPGQRYDAASELVYNYFRDYDPTTGRYIQSDLIGQEGGLDSYGYVGANPLILTDRFGLAAELNWFHPRFDASLYAGAQAYISPDGTFTIAAHAFVNTLYLKGPDGGRVSAQQLWDLMKVRFKAGKFKRIRLAACTAGQQVIDGRSIASDLAAIAHVPVEASPLYVGFVNGRVVLGNPIPGQQGRMTIDQNAEFGRFSQQCKTYSHQCY